jgi:hypothetical protein
MAQFISGPADIYFNGVCIGRTGELSMTEQEWLELNSSDVTVEDNGCWLWKWSTNSYGYGHFTENKKTVAVHRRVWELCRSPIPSGLFVLHNCPDGDNPRCCRPSHLWLGTHKDNMNDMVKKGRSPRSVFFGEHNGRAVLTDEFVQYARELAGKIGQRRAARMLAASTGLSANTIRGAIRGNTWTK